MIDNSKLVNALDLMVGEKRTSDTMLNMEETINIMLDKLFEFACVWSNENSDYEWNDDEIGKQVHGFAMELRDWLAKNVV